MRTRQQIVDTLEAYDKLTDGLFYRVCLFEKRVGKQLYGNLYKADNERLFFGGYEYWYCAPIELLLFEDVETSVDAAVEIHKRWELDRKTEQRVQKQEQISRTKAVLAKLIAELNEEDIG